MGGKRGVGGELQLIAQGGFLLGRDSASATRWRTWGHRTGQALLAKPAGNAALADLKGRDQLLTGEATRVGVQDALAQIG